jgi:cytoskeletal protein CcmA (bactofilin family)
MWKRERPEPVDLEQVMTESPAVVAPATRPVTPPVAPATRPVTPPVAPVVEVPAQRASAAKCSTLGATLRFKGDLVADEDLVIQGQIEGSVLHTRSLTIGSQGRVRGDIRARRIIVEGSVEGNLYALERASLRTGAAVRGDIFAAEIVIDEGACLNGRIDMDNAPAVPTIKIPLPGSTEPVTSELSSPEADALLAGS